MLSGQPSRPESGINYLVGIETFRNSKIAKGGDSWDRGKIVGSCQSDKIKELTAGYDTHVDRNVNHPCSRGNEISIDILPPPWNWLCKSPDAIGVIGVWRNNFLYQNSILKNVPIPKQILSTSYGPLRYTDWKIYNAKFMMHFQTKDPKHMYLRIRRGDSL